MEVDYGQYLSYRLRLLALSDSKVVKIQDRQRRGIPLSVSTSNINRRKTIPSHELEKSLTYIEILSTH